MLQYCDIFFYFLYLYVDIFNNMTIKNTTFINYIDNVIKNITKKYNVKNYFNLNDEQKLSIIYSVFTQLKTNTKISVISNDFKTLIVILTKKCEKDENYEMASLLSSINKKFDSLSDIYENKLLEIKKKKTENI